MAVFTLNVATINEATGSQYKVPGKRHRAYAKVLSPERIDLTQRGGYAMRSPFVNWGNAFAAHDGEYVFVNIGDEYHLLEVVDGHLQNVPWKTIRAALTETTALTDTQKAAAFNNAFYEAACYVAVFGERGVNPGFEVNA